MWVVRAGAQCSAAPVAPVWKGEVLCVTYNARSTHFCLLSLSSIISFPVKTVLGSNPNTSELVLTQRTAFQQTSSHHEFCRYLYLIENGETESCFGH